MKYIYTDDQKEVVELRKQGKTFREIGVLLGKASNTVRSLYNTAVRRHNVAEVHPDNYTNYTKRQLEVAQLRENGLTFMQIGEILGINPNTVGNHYKAYIHKLTVNKIIEESSNGKSIKELAETYNWSEERIEQYVRVYKKDL